MHKRIAIAMNGQYRKKNCQTYLLHAGCESLLHAVSLFLGVLSNVVGYLHRAKLWPAHGTKVCRLATARWERFVMVRPCSRGVKSQIELVVPPKFKASLGQGIIPDLPPRNVVTARKRNGSSAKMPILRRSSHRE